MRPSALRRISRLSIAVAGRTSMVELAAVTERMAAVTRRRVPRRTAWRATVLAVAGALLVLLLSAAFALERWRWLPRAFLFLAVLAMLGGASLSVLPRLARRFGERELPGHTVAWLALGFTILAGGAWTITRHASAAIARAGQALSPTFREYFPSLAPPPAPEEPLPPKAVDVASRVRRQIWVSPGVLFIPPSFEPTEDGFDVLLHFHGNTVLVQESVEASGLNALVLITNLGASSHDYQQPFGGSRALDALLAKIQDKAGLAQLKVRRVALSSWSAGFGAPLAILNDPQSAERVDALLVMDGIHGGFVPGQGRAVDPAGIAPFVAFAKQAAAGRRLMWVTHSDIDTYEYSSSTESADAILADLGIRREPEDTSPPAPELESAVRAFPAHSPHWLQARSAAKLGEFHLAGYAGKGPEDHIAQLAQMSVTVLPALVKRWDARTAAPSAPPSP